MNSNLIESISRVCKILAKHSVQYLIVGGASVAFYGYYRLSTAPTGRPAEKYDFDFWYNPSYGNYFNLLNALEELGQDVSEFKKEQHQIRIDHSSDLSWKLLQLISCQVCLAFLNFPTPIILRK
jgi:hypothetical protein